MRRPVSTTRRRHATALPPDRAAGRDPTLGRCGQADFRSTLKTVHDDLTEAVTSSAVLRRRSFGPSRPRSLANAPSPRLELSALTCHWGGREGEMSIEQIKLLVI